MHERSIARFRRPFPASGIIWISYVASISRSRGTHLKLFKLKVVENRNRRAILLSMACVAALAASALLTTACDSREQHIAEASPAALPADAVRVPQEIVPLIGDWVATLDGFVNARSFGLQPKRTSFQSHWQNGVAERFTMAGGCG
jgi:hypothetical protein